MAVCGEIGELLTRKFEDKERRSAEEEKRKRETEMTSLIEAWDPEWLEKDWIFASNTPRRIYERPRDSSHVLRGSVSRNLGTE